MVNVLKFMGILLLVAPIARASDNKIFLFGGVASRKAEISSCYRDPRYTNFGYPAEDQVAKVVAEINNHPDKAYTIAGHSSGAQYANMVAQQVENPERITLVDLDGFAPRNVPAAVKRVCWKAVNGKGLSSRNAGSMTAGNNCQIVKTHLAPACRTKWCLHFSLVNPNAPEDLNSATWRTHGYRDCTPNLEWLEP